LHGQGLRSQTEEREGVWDPAIVHLTRGTGREFLFKNVEEAEKSVPAQGEKHLHARGRRNRCDKGPPATEKKRKKWSKREPGIFRGEFVPGDVTGGFRKPGGVGVRKKGRTRFDGGPEALGKKAYCRSGKGSLLLRRRGDKALLKKRFKRSSSY